MSGTLQVGGITLGTHNSGTGKVDITNAGTATVATLNTTSIASGTLGSSVVVPASIGSSMVHLKTLTTSAGDTEILLENGVNGVVLDSTYTIHVLHLSGIVPTTDSKQIYIQVGSSTGYDAGYRGGYSVWYNNGSSVGGSAGSSLNSSYFWNSQPNALHNAKANAGLTGTFIFHNFASATYAINAYFDTIFYGSNGYFYGMVGQSTTVNQYVGTRIKFTTNSDSFASGAKISLYGIKDA